MLHAKDLEEFWYYAECVRNLRELGHINCSAKQLSFLLRRFGVCTEEKVDEVGLMEVFDVNQTPLFNCCKFSNCFQAHRLKRLRHTSLVEHKIQLCCKGLMFNFTLVRVGYVALGDIK